jgi:L-lactate dehydrogenase complex protein LldF
VKVLNHAGIRVVFPDAQTCCGAPARYGGAPEAAAEAASANVEALSSAKADYVVSACPTCTVALKSEFSALLREHGTAEQLQKAEQIAGKCVDFSTLVLEMTRQGRLCFSQDEPEGTAITYHDSCHLKRTLGVFREPRELLALAGHEIREMPESDVCCGMGGSYSLKLPAVSLAVLQRKLDNIRTTAAPEVNTDCP